MIIENTLGSAKYKFAPGIDICFICGIKLDSANNSKEHVFPKWLLSKYQLYDHQIGQLNGSGQFYRTLKVPCCIKCNGSLLSPVEKRISEVFSGGFDNFKNNLSDKDLFIWLSKIYYGILYNESLKPANPREPNGKRIVDPRFVEYLGLLHFLLQTVRGLVEWGDRNPATIFIYRCLTSSESELNFDYLDYNGLPVLGIRIGDIGIICLFEDWGSSYNIRNDHLSAAERISLHPTQFREVFVRWLEIYLNSEVKHSYLISENEIMQVIPIFLKARREADFNVERYVSHLARYWDVETSDILNANKAVITYLIDNAGQPLQFEDIDIKLLTLKANGLWPYGDNIVQRSQ